MKVDVATSTDPATLYVKYTKTGVGNATTDFVSTETLSATHPTLGIITAVCDNSLTGSALQVSLQVHITLMVLLLMLMNNQSY